MRSSCRPYMHWLKVNRSPDIRRKLFARSLSRCMRPAGSLDCRKPIPRCARPFWQTPPWTLRWATKGSRSRTTHADTSLRVASFTELCHSPHDPPGKCARSHQPVTGISGLRPTRSAESKRLSTPARHGPHQYAVTWGAPAFRQALARKQSHFTGLDIDPDANHRRHLRQHRGHDGRDDDRLQPATACGVLALLQKLRRRHDSFGAERSTCPCIRPPSTSTRPSCGGLCQRPKAIILCNRPILRSGLHEGRT